MGDTRDKTTYTMTGVSPDLPKMAEAIAQEQPDFVIHTGDLANGYYTTQDSLVHGKFKAMFRNWKSAARPIYDYQNKKGIPIYIVRGNHEDGKVITDAELKKAYIEEFARFMPQTALNMRKVLPIVFCIKAQSFLPLTGITIKKQWLSAGM